MRTLTARVLLLVITATVLHGCKQFSLADANVLQKGMQAGAVLAVVAKGPQDSYEITLPSDTTMRFHVMVFRMHVGNSKGDYYAAFRNDSLFYWGYPYEWNRHPDSIIREVGLQTTSVRARDAGIRY